MRVARLIAFEPGMCLEAGARSSYSDHDIDRLSPRSAASLKDQRSLETRGATQAQYRLHPVLRF